MAIFQLVWPMVYCDIPAGVAICYRDIPAGVAMCHRDIPDGGTTPTWTLRVVTVYRAHDPTMGTADAEIKVDHSARELLKSPLTTSKVT